MSIVVVVEHVYMFLLLCRVKYIYMRIWLAFRLSSVVCERVTSRVVLVICIMPQNELPPVCSRLKLSMLGCGRRRAILSLLTLGYALKLTLEHFVLAFYANQRKGNGIT